MGTSNDDDDNNSILICTGKRGFKRVSKLRVNTHIVQLPPVLLQNDVEGAALRVQQPERG